MAWQDYTLTAAILIFLALLIWSRVQEQQMIDTLREIRDFTRETFVGKVEQVQEVVKA